MDYLKTLIFNVFSIFSQFGGRSDEVQPKAQVGPFFLKPSLTQRLQDFFADGSLMEKGNTVMKFHVFSMCLIFLYERIFIYEVYKRKSSIIRAKKSLYFFTETFLSSQIQVEKEFMVFQFRCFGASDISVQMCKLCFSFKTFNH